MNRIKITSVDYHRNGSAGTGFYVVLFQRERGKSIERFVATVFPERRSIAVLDIDLLTAGNIRFAENSWDGPEFEDECRRAILTRAEKLAHPPIEDEERREVLYGKHACVPYSRDGSLIVAESKIGTCVICGIRIAE